MARKCSSDQIVCLNMLLLFTKHIHITLQVFSIFIQIFNKITVLQLFDLNLLHLNINYCKLDA